MKQIAEIFRVCLFYTPPKKFRGESCLLFLPGSHRATLECSLTIPVSYPWLRRSFDLLTCLWTQRHNSPPLLPAALHMAYHHSLGRGYCIPGSFFFWRKHHMDSIQTSSSIAHQQQLQGIKETPSWQTSTIHNIYFRATCDRDDGKFILAIFRKFKIVKVKAVGCI